MKILEINDVKKTYSNGKEALKSISFSVDKGEFIALLGPNGAGKSTLINILSDVVVKTSGKAKVCGYDLDTQKINFKRHIGIVPQDINFDPFSTAFETLCSQQGLYGLKTDKARVLELLEKMGLKDQAHVNSRSLSGGMKRRLLVAKALIHDPEIVILDEPTAGVDVELRQHLWAYLKELNAKGKTIILTTHYLEEADYLCNKIAVINKGQLITYDKKETLMRKLGHQTLELSIDSNINDFNFIKDYEINKINDQLISINYNNGDEIAKIISSFNDNNITINNVNIKKSNLEDVFLKLVS